MKKSKSSGKKKKPKRKRKVQHYALAPGDPCMCSDCREKQGYER